jgi:hypothetical protein
LQSLPGVANLEIDSKARTVIVSGDAEEFVVEDAVAALDECGFPAEETETLSESL